MFDETVLEELVALVENEDFGFGEVDNGAVDGADKAERSADETIDRLFALLEYLPDGLEESEQWGNGETMFIQISGILISNTYQFHSQFTQYNK